MTDVVDLLVCRGANIVSTRMAAGAGKLARVQTDLPSIQRDTDSLHDVFRCAAVCGRIEVVDLLLNNSVDVNAVIKGATVLHWAAWEAKAGMVKFLLSRGADPAATDQKHSLTPAGCARHRRKELGPRWGHDEVIQLLGGQ